MAEFMRQCEYKAKHEGRIFGKDRHLLSVFEHVPPGGHKLRGIEPCNRRGGRVRIAAHNMTAT